MLNTPYCIFTWSFVMDPNVLFGAVLGCHVNKKLESILKIAAFRWFHKYIINDTRTHSEIS